jgi:hypothetical protein
MAAHTPALPLEADPLVAEAKRRARRRRLVMAAATIVVAGTAAGATYSLRSSGNVLALCATPPSGWKEHTIPRTPTRVATVVLTNFRFGRMDDAFGLAAPLAWPPRGAMIAVSNEGPAATPPFRRALEVGKGDFRGFEGMRWPAANVALRSHGRVLDAYVELHAVTPATVAAANAALAGIHTCST